MKRLAAFLLSVMLAVPVLAVQPDEMLKDQALEQRARVISKDLRCLVCQNQSIDDSDAPLARDLRLVVRERLTAGDSNEKVVDYVVSRYGEFVLLKPRFGLHTVILWALPLLVLLFGFIGLSRLKNRSRAIEAPKPLSAEEQARLDALMKNDPLP